LTSPVFAIGWSTRVRGVRSSDDKYELALYAKALFNQAYTTFGRSAASDGNIQGATCASSVSRRH
jgi:hypothetical protein